MQLCQLYNELGQPLPGQGGSMQDIFNRGLLHGAVHICVWRRAGDSAEILLQKRTATMLTWPNCYDISAGGHIDLGEEPLTAALRETKEEINLDVDPAELEYIDRVRSHLIAPNGSNENEFQWVYLLKLTENHRFTIQESEVASVEWVSLADFRTHALSRDPSYVPHSPEYFQMLIDTISERLER